MLAFKAVARANMTSNKKGDLLPSTDIPTCVNIRKVHLNKRGYKCLLNWSLDPKNIYIGRDMTHYVKGAVGSKWQNPFMVNEYGIKKCLEMYEEKIRKTPELMLSINELEGMQLGCWCNPSPCHGDILIILFTVINSEKIKI